MHEAVIISDLHLGSDNCRGKALRKFLHLIGHGLLPTRRLILAGDVFDSIDFRRLDKDHWKALSLLRKLAQHTEVVWLAGNHDGSAEIVSHLLGVSVLDHYELDAGEVRILVTHGHTFDDFLDAHPVVTWLADCVYAVLQWIDPTYTFARWAKHSSKTFLRCARKIEEGAVEMARRRGCQAAVCGHTHVACAHEDQPMPYYNAGCWTELPCTYLTVGADGVKLCEFQEKS